MKKPILIKQTMILATFISILLYIFDQNFNIFNHPTQKSISQNENFYSPYTKNIPEAKINFNLEGYERYLNSQPRNEVDSIKRGLLCLVYNTKSFSPHDKDLSFLAFREFYYEVIKKANEMLYNNKALTNIIYKDIENNNINLSDFTANLNNPDPGLDMEIIKYFQKLWENGLILSISEGILYIVEQPGYFGFHFDGLISESLTEFMSIREEELNQGFAEDASLLISFSDLGERVASWEKYLEKYPDSRLNTEAERYYNLYLTTFLKGMDNTKLFDKKGHLKPEVKMAYIEYVKRNPHSQSGKLVKKFYETAKK